MVFRNLYGKTPLFHNQTLGTFPPLEGEFKVWSADSLVRASLASDQVQADKAGRAPVSRFLECTLFRPWTHLLFAERRGTQAVAWPRPASPSGGRASGSAMRGFSIGRAKKRLHSRSKGR